MDNVRTVVHQSDMRGAGLEEQTNVIQEERILTVKSVQSSHSKVIPHDIYVIELFYCLTLSNIRLLIVSILFLLL